MAIVSNSSNIPVLSPNWNFQPSHVALWEQRRFIENFLSFAHRRPRWLEIKAVVPQEKWIVYFLYSPKGALTASHHYTLGRLKDLGVPLLVVCSCVEKNHIPRALHGYCDALIWKDLPGYDFSAYTLALQQISRCSAGANVLVLNDSILGPFTDLRPVLNDSRWDLTGFTASGELTNHIQSYSFCLKNVCPTTMLRLAPVFFPFFAISERQAVIYLQELRMARVAARSMKVGAYWFSDTDNPTLKWPIELLDSGYPFLKRALLVDQDPVIKREEIILRLEQYGHPIDF